MGFVRYLFLICFFVLLVSPVMANVCSKEDTDYADFWQNYYTPEDAYAFGLKVQSLVSNQDLSGIFRWSKANYKMVLEKNLLQTRPSKKCLMKNGYRRC